MEQEDTWRSKNKHSSWTLSNLQGQIVEITPAPPLCAR